MTRVNNVGLFVRTESGLDAWALEGLGPKICSEFSSEMGDGVCEGPLPPYFAEVEVGAAPSTVWI